MGTCDVRRAQELRPMFSDAAAVRCEIRFKLFCCISLRRQQAGAYKWVTAGDLKSFCSRSAAGVKGQPPKRGREADLVTSESSGLLLPCNCM